jgi:hypothetical protein
MMLKPRPAPNIAMFVGGVFLALIGFVSAWAIGLYAGIVPAVVGVLGLFWICTAMLMLLRRRSLAITIDQGGIRLPIGKIFYRRIDSILVPREIIASISKHESLRGRLVEITLTTGEKVPVQARHYCELKHFLSHCKAHELPVV